MPVCVTQWQRWSSINATVISSADGAKIQNDLGTLSTNYENNESEGISIVISSHKNKGLHNDGNAHIIEYDALAGEEIKDTTGLAEREEVNGSSVRELRVVPRQRSGLRCFRPLAYGRGRRCAGLRLGYLLM